MKSKVLNVFLGIFVAGSIMPQCLAIEVSGKWHKENLSNTNASAEPLKTDLGNPEWIFAKHRANVKFDSALWRTVQDRTALLSAFAYDNPVIGMEKSTVRTLLGEPIKHSEEASSDVYFIVGNASCIVGKRPNSHGSLTFFELGYENDKVTAYRVFTKGEK
jgi:hypothetical protein